MSAYSEDWKRIEYRLMGWLEASKLFLTLPEEKNGWEKSIRLLFKQLKEINNSLRNYKKNYPNVPHSSAINDYLPMEGSKYNNQQRVVNAIENWDQDGGLQEYFFHGYSIVSCFVSEAAYLHPF